MSIDTPNISNRSSSSLKLRIALIAFALLIVSFISLLVVRNYIPVSMGYNLACEFTNMPADDEELTIWLINQPGVVEHSVHTDRIEDSLHVLFIQTRTMAGNPPIPDLDKHTKQLGYETTNIFRENR